MRLTYANPQRLTGRIRLMLQGFVPRLLRSRWPLRGLYWQAGELAEAQERAELLRGLLTGEAESPTTRT